MERGRNSVGLGCPGVRSRDEEGEGTSEQRSAPVNWGLGREGEGAWSLITGMDASVQLRRWGEWKGYMGSDSHLQLSGQGCRSREVLSSGPGRGGFLGASSF